MPHLSDCLPHDPLLLDPVGGSAGMHNQISELIQVYGAESVNVIDVGGDAVARADEPRLRSPLADGLALSACDGLHPVAVVVAGAASTEKSTKPTYSLPQGCTQSPASPTKT